MIFWFLCAVLTTATIVIILLPLVRRDAPAQDGGQADVRVYKDQLAEIDREQDRGLLQPAEADAARTEVARRLIGADSAASAMSSKASTFTRTPIVVYATTLFVVGFALLAYLAIGRPGEPGTNHAERLRQDPRTLPVSEQIARVEARLRERPDDATGWDVIGPVYLKLRQYRKAADAFRQAIKLNGPTPPRLAGFTQASLALTNGIVTKDIRVAFEQILKQRPKNIPARFWLSIAKEQAGDKTSAAQGYKALLADPAVTPQFRAMLQQRLTAVGGNPDVPTAPPSAPAQSTVPAPQTATGAAIAALPPKEQRKAIEGMVDGLATRLNRDGGTPADWQRLVRAYMVLGQRDKAREALEGGRKAFAGNTEALNTLDLFAKRIGVID